MPEKSGFFDSTADDMREYPARDFAEYFARFVTNGVFNGGQYLNPTASGQDANISLSPGAAWINGYAYSVYDSPLVLPIEPAAAFDRIDRIILRLDTSTPVRAIRALVVQGLPASNPVPPSLVRSGNIYDLSIAQVRVPANSTIITQDNITDERLNQDVCGLVNSLIRVDTATFQAQWDDFIQSVQNQGFVTTTKFNTHLADYVRQPGFAVTSGTSTAYTVTLDPAPTDLDEGFGITIVPHVDCGEEPTLEVNGLGPVALKDQKGAAYSEGKLVAGKPYTFRLVGTDFLADSGSGAEGDATANDLRLGKTATVATGEVITGSLDLTNLIPENVKKDVSIDGVIGTLEQRHIMQPGDIPLYSRAQIYSSTSTSFSAVAEAVTVQKGTYRTRFSMRSPNTSLHVQGAVFKNGVQHGTLRSTNSTTNVAFTEDLSFEDGDVVDFRCKTASNTTMYMGALSISGDAPNYVQDPRGLV